MWLKVCSNAHAPLTVMPYIFFFKIKNCLNDDIFISCNDRIGKMLHNICHLHICSGYVTQASDPWPSCFFVCFFFLFCFCFFVFCCCFVVVFFFFFFFCFCFFFFFFFFVFFRFITKLVFLRLCHALGAGLFGSTCAEKCWKQEYWLIGWLVWSLTVQTTTLSALSIHLTALF